MHIPMRRCPVLLGCWLGLLLGIASPALAKEQWSKVSTPRYSIVTADSADTAKEWAMCLEGFRQFLRNLGPTDDRVLDPMLVVIFPGDAEFYRIFPKPPDENFNQTTTSWIKYSTWIQRDGRFLCAINPVRADLARQSYFMLTGLWATQAYYRPLPRWLSNGLLQFYLTASFQRDRVTLGGPSSQNKRQLGGKVVIPLEQLLAATTDVTGRAKALNDDNFYAESWAFVHFLVSGEDGANRAALVRYIGALEAGRSAQQATAEAFPGGLEEVGRRFAKYVKSGSYRAESVPVAQGDAANAVHAAPATDVESQLALGYTRLMADASEQAEPFFNRAAELQPNAPSTLEAQADLAYLRHDEAQAADYYRRAVQAGSHWYMAHFLPAAEISRSLFGSEIAMDHGDPAVARQAAEALRQTLQMNPTFYPALERYAGLIGALAEVTEEDGRFLTESMERFPRKMVLEVGRAAYELKSGQIDAARARLDRLRSEQIPGPDYAIAYAEKIEARIQAIQGLAQAQAAYDQGALDRAHDALIHLPRASLSPEEQQRYESLLAAMASVETLANVRAAIDRKDFEAAEVLLAGVPAENLPEKIRAEVAALSAQVTAGKNTAAKK